MLDLSKVDPYLKPAEGKKFVLEGQGTVVIQSTLYQIDEFLWERHPEFRKDIQRTIRGEIWHKVYGDLQHPFRSLVYHCMTAETLLADPRRIESLRGLQEQIKKLLEVPK